MFLHVQGDCGNFQRLCLHIFYFQGLMPLWVITALLVLVHSDHESVEGPVSDTAQQIRDKEVSVTATPKGTYSKDEKEVSGSHFVPSFGPLHPPQHHYNPLEFHTFGPTPILAY